MTIPSNDTHECKLVLLPFQAPANKGTTVSFPIIPSVIGQMRVRVTARTSGAADAVQRNLLVEVSVYIHTCTCMYTSAIQKHIIRKKSLTLCGVIFLVFDTLIM